MTLLTRSTIDAVASNDKYHRVYLKREVVADSQYPFSAGDTVIVTVLPGADAVLVQDPMVSLNAVVEAVSRRADDGEEETGVIAHGRS